MKIGVFDSGIGGEAIARRLQEIFPDAEILSVNDHDHMPYGSRPEDEIIALTTAAIQPLLEAHCDAIVIACNTATTVAITHLREAYPDTPFIGIEPMIKPASLSTKTGTIAVLATPATLASQRYHALKEEWAAKLQVIEPDCRTWAELIENNQMDQIDVETTVREVVTAGADQIVLGCTHYHWLKDRIARAAGPGVSVLEPSDAIGQRIISLLSQAAAPPQ